MDSSEIAFKTAAQLAYKAAMPEANPVLLEPIGELKVTRTGPTRRQTGRCRRSASCAGPASPPFCGSSPGRGHGRGRSPPGSYHPVDSSEIAFKTAAQLAYKAAMPEANPILLEPVGELKVTIPDSYMGDVMGDITKRRGRGMKRYRKSSNYPELYQGKQVCCTCTHFVQHYRSDEARAAFVEVGCGHCGFGLPAGP